MSEDENMSRPAIPEIETERLVLRGPADGDVEAWATHLTNPADFRFIPWRKTDETPHERSARILGGLEKLWAKQPPGGMGWVIVRKADPLLIGLGGLDQVEGTSDGEIDYRLGRPFWGQGYASEAARAMMRYGFENTAWDRVVAYVVPENTASVRVAQGLGMRYEKDVDYAEIMGDLTNYEIASPITALYAIARAQYTPGDEAYRVRRASGQ